MSKDVDPSTPPDHDDMLQHIFARIPLERRAAWFAHYPDFVALTPSERLLKLRLHERLVDLPAEQTILALPDAMLARLPESFLAALPADIPAAVRARLQR